MSVTQFFASSSLVTANSTYLNALLISKIQFELSPNTMFAGTDC
jgi:hypothetical protein